MNVFNGMGLEGVGPFKKQAFAFVPGIHTIYGLNRAGGAHSSNGNAAGKSYFFSSLKEMIYEEPVVGEKKDRVREGKRTFEFRDTQGKIVRVERQARGRAEHLAITVNGKELKHLTATKARAYLKRIFPITQEEYDTFVHIDARIPHPLVMGNGTARKKFFTDFFGLDKIDAERKLYAAALKELQQIKAGFSELLVAYKAAKRDLLEDTEASKLQFRVKQHKQQLQLLNEESAEISETKRLVQFMRDSKEQVAQLTNALVEVNDETFKEARTNNVWETKRVLSQLEDAEEWERYLVQTQHYEEAYASLSTEAKRYLKANGRDALGNAREAARLLSNYREVLRNRKVDVATVEQQLAEPLPEKIEKPDGEEGELETLQRAYAHQLEHAEQFGDGKCETCGQVVKIKDPRVLRRKLDSLTVRLRAFEEYRQYAAAIKDHRKLTFQLKAHQSDVKRALDKVATVKADASLYSELKDLPKRPRPFEGKKLQTKVLRIALEELKERASLLQFLSPHVDTIVAFNALTKEQRLKVKNAPNLHERINTLQENISKIQAKLEVHNSVKERVEEMRTRLVAMKRQLRDEEPLRLLVQGFSDKHMKKMAIEAIGANLMGIVNKYAKIVFAEDYRFSFEWGTDLNLLVHRKYGKRVDVSDVRKLSGAESKLFTLILVLALLTFVPENKRSSLLILDEPTANFSEETVRAFQDLLPVLNKVIPCILIITPKSQDVYEGAKNYTVVKVNGQSKIVSGHPREFKDRKQLQTNN